MATLLAVPRRCSPYDWRYQQERAALLAPGPPCALLLVCDGSRADSADHDPPLGLHDHVPGSGCCRLRPACLPCQHEQGRIVGLARRHPVGRSAPPPSRAW